MAYAIYKHEYMDIKKFKLFGKYKRYVAVQLDKKCLVCSKTKAKHDLPLKVDSYE